MRVKHIDRISRDLLREIPMGETEVYELPTYMAVMAARTTASTCQIMMGCQFKTNVSGDRKTIISITKLPSSDESK